MPEAGRTLGKCECEHTSHFGEGEGHAYGAERWVRPVTTTYGTFMMCRECEAEVPSMFLINAGGRADEGPRTQGADA